jgi:hypothetical protein
MENFNIGEHKRKSIFSAFQKDIVKADENSFDTFDEFEKAVADNKWLVYSEESIANFAYTLLDMSQDITKGDAEDTLAIIEKGKKDLSKLSLKLIVDKRGFAKKVWVGNGGANTAHDESQQELLDEQISKKNNVQMQHAREDIDHAEAKDKKNDMAHEEVVDWADKIQDIHTATDTAVGMDEFQAIADEYGWKNTYGGSGWMENWIAGESLTNIQLKEIHDKLSKIK